jgi:hypothetical protein
MRLQVPKSPLVEGSILDKKKGRTPKRMPSLEELSPTITTHFKIEIISIHYNAIDNLYL